MKARQRHERVMRRVISGIIFALIVVIVLPTNLASFQTGEQGATTILSLVTALILAIGAADPVANLINLVIDALFQRSRRIPPAELREPILEAQRRLWIDGVLKRAVEHEPLQVPFAVSQAMEGRIRDRVEGRASRDQPDETTVVGRRRARRSRADDSIAAGQYKVRDAYEAAGQQLVILGESGSGKTIALLQLLESLHKDATEKSALPLPIIFNLGSWVEKQLPLDQWFVSEIADILPDDPPIGSLRFWVDERRVIFLIDGLDEVPQKARERLMVELQQFVLRVKDVNQTRLVICSRPDEYASVRHLAPQLPFETLSLRPVEDEQIKHFLEGSDYQDLRDLIFKGQRRLYRPVHRPFILNALATAYRSPTQSLVQELNDALERGADLIEGKDLEPVPRVILDRYVGHQFTQAALREADYGRYNNEVTRGYLTWIARKLQDVRGEQDKAGTEVLVEYLQPMWLDSNLWRWAYSIVSRAIGTAAITVAIGFFLASPFDYLLPGLLAGVVVGLLDGLVLYTPLAQLPKRIGGWAYGIVRLVSTYIGTALALSVPLGLLTPSPPEDRILNGLVSLTGITLAWFLPLFIATIYTTRKFRLYLPGDIQLIEKTKIEIRRMVRFGLLGGLGVGSVAATFAQLLSLRELGSSALWIREIVAASESSLINPISVGFLVGAFFGGLIAAAFGLLSAVDIEERLKPNQGIRQSFDNARTIAVQVTTVSAIVFGIGLWLYYDDMDAVYRALRNALAIGLLAGLWYGGIDTIHHAVLRFFLYVSGCIPWGFTNFLRYSSRCNLMREIGASFMFGHEYLRIYFTIQETPQRVVKPIPTAVAGAAFVLTVGGITLLPTITDSLLSFRATAQYVIAGATDVTVDGQSICVEEGERVVIESRGIIRSGHFMGYITPEGSDVGFLGLPAGDAFDRAPSVPNNALICKLDSDAEWRMCAAPSTPVMFPWDTRTAEFVAPRAGCLQFEINEIEEEKRSGRFFARVSLDPQP